MAEPISKKLIAGIIGATAIITLAGPEMMKVALASDTGVSRQVASLVAAPTGRALDTTHLVRVDANYYALNTEPGVSLTPETEAHVRKIGFGITSIVDILTTSSGTYSSAGLVSPNVRYPGVHTAQLKLVALPFSGSIEGWSRLSGWVNIPLLSSNSIGILDDISVPASRDGTCVVSNADGACR